MRPFTYRYCRSGCARDADGSPIQPSSARPACANSTWREAATKSAPTSFAMRASRSRRPAAGGNANCSRRLCVSVNATSKRDSASRVTVRRMCWYSVASARRNFRRAGTR